MYEHQHSARIALNESASHYQFLSKLNTNICILYIKTIYIEIYKKVSLLFVLLVKYSHTRMHIYIILHLQKTRYPSLSDSRFCCDHCMESTKLHVRYIG